MNWVEMAHFPIIIELEIGGEKQGEAGIEKGIQMVRYTWNNEKRDNFWMFFQSTAFGREYDNINKMLEGGETAGPVNRVNNTLKEALSVMKKKDRGGKGIGWFSKGCKEKRKEVKSLLKEFRKENSDITRENFC